MNFKNANLSYNCILLGALNYGEYVEFYFRKCTIQNNTITFDIGYMSNGTKLGIYSTNVYSIPMFIYGIVI